MRPSRVRFTTASLMLAILLLGLNLAGGLATSRYDPETPYPGAIMFDGSREFPTLPDQDGMSYVYRPDHRHVARCDGWRLVSVGRRPLPPTPLRIWSPVLASVSVTLLILLVPCRRAMRSIGLLRSTRSDRSQLVGRAPRVIRDLAIVLALLALNIAGAASRPLPGRSSIDLDCRRMFGGVPRTLAIRIDGTIVQRHPLDGSDQGVWFLPCTDPLDEQLYTLREGTIEYRPDGRIVAYAGSPEQKASRPFLIRPPTRTFVEVWWPVLSSGAITLLVMGLLRPARPPR